jgi:hypothetical protein
MTEKQKIIFEAALQIYLMETKTDSKMAPCDQLGDERVMECAAVVAINLFDMTMLVLAEANAKKK